VKHLLMAATWSRMRNERQTVVLHLGGEERRITSGRVSLIVTTAIQQFMVVSSKLCKRYFLRLPTLNSRITGVAQLVRHETGMRLPMLILKRVFVQAADTWAMELLFPTWSAEHLRTK
jgi:hypothetical protein